MKLCILPKNLLKVAGRTIRPFTLVGFVERFLPDNLHEKVLGGLEISISLLSNGEGSCGFLIPERTLRANVYLTTCFHKCKGIHSVSCAASMALAMAAAGATPRVKVAVAQMTSISNTDTNFLTCARLVQEAAAAGAKLLSLPECFSFIGSKDGEALSIAEPLTGPIIRRYQTLAREAGLWLALGGFQEKGPDDKHLYNTHVLLNDSGEICSYYRKIHLFDVDVPGGPVLKESNSAAPGSEIVVVDSPAGRLGLTVCYDLRFPEIYQRLRFTENSQVLLVPSAFTKTTGQAHWELLLRARAIETQCYVLAAAQAGKHNEKRESYGDAMIIDPWGEVIARLPDKLMTGIATADVDQSMLQSIRLRMPIEKHRRYDIYGPSTCQKQKSAYRSPTEDGRLSPL